MYIFFLSCEKKTCNGKTINADHYIALTELTDEVS